MPTEGTEGGYPSVLPTERNQGNYPSALPTEEALESYPSAFPTKQDSGIFTTELPSFLPSQAPSYIAGGGPTGLPTYRDRESSGLIKASFVEGCVFVAIGLLMGVVISRCVRSTSRLGNGREHNSNRPERLSAANSNHEDDLPVAIVIGDSEDDTRLNSTLAHTSSIQGASLMQDDLNNDIAQGTVNKDDVELIEQDKNNNEDEDEDEFFDAEVDFS